MSFVFYDTETTGTHTAFDQILQFAAIHTDENLNEIDRFEIRCRLLPHVVPSPGAMKVTRVTIEQLLDPTLPTHYSMTCNIAGRLRDWSPAIFTGWNTMRFDESMLRQAFYQNLHSPYLTNSHGNGRTDIMTLAQALTALKPGVLAVPLNEKGKPTFKLDRLAPANGFEHFNAHDALADVEATIHLARLIRERAPTEWKRAIAHSVKANVVEFIAREPAFILTECYFSRPRQFPLTQIGIASENAGTIFALDLRADMAALRSLGDQDLVTRVSRSPRIVRTIRANAGPVLSRLDKAENLAGVSHQEWRDRADAVQGDQTLCERLVAAAAAKPDDRASKHVEEQIYSSFFTRTDETRMRDFHRVEWEDRLAIIDQFEDQRLAQLGARLVFAHRPDLLNDEQANSQQRWLAHRLHGGDGKVPWLTVDRAITEIEGVFGAGESENVFDVASLRHHLQTL